MVSSDNDRLEQLRNDVWNNKEKLESTNSKISSKQKELSSFNRQNDQINSEMNQLISKFVGQSEVSNARERKIIESKLESFSYQQQAMNTNIVELVDLLKSTKALDEAYQTKKDELLYLADEQAQSYRRMLEQERKNVEEAQERHEDLKKKVAKERTKLAGLKFFKGFKYLITSNATLILIIAILIFLFGIFVGINTDKLMEGTLFEDEVAEQQVQTEQTQQPAPQQ